MLRAARGGLLFGAFASACVAGLTGFLLSYEGGFDDAVVFWHLRLGVLIILGTLAAFFFHQFQSVDGRGWMARSYRISLGATALAVLVNGHLGGVLAHGPDYLTEYLPASVRRVLPIEFGGRDQATLDPETLTVFDGLVAPVLRANCLECHSDTRRRGGLSLADAGTVQEGGESGPVVVPGDSLASELVRRITLPLDDEDRMPPGDREPLEIGAVERIRWWIDQGASADQRVFEAGEVPFHVQVYLARAGMLGTGRAGRPRITVDLPSADPAMLRNLEEKGFVVSPVAEKSPLLAVRLPAGRELDQAGVESLEPLAALILWLDLSGVSLKEGTAAFFEGLENLARLNLSMSNVEDEDLRHLEGLSGLEYLNLYGTAVGDAGLGHLARLEGLRSLYLWQTDVTPEGASQLAAQIPNCSVNLGAE